MSGWIVLLYIGTGSQSGCQVHEHISPVKYYNGTEVPRGCGGPMGWGPVGLWEDRGKKYP